MLRRLRVQGFKSLTDVRMELPSFAVFFGPNAVGKSNLLDALQAISRLAREQTLADALQQPIRGYAAEAFSFPPGGLQELLRRPSAEFTLEVDVETGQPPSVGSNGHPSRASSRRFRYRVTVRIEPATGGLSVQDEYLCELTASWEPKSRPRVEREDDRLVVRRHGTGRPERQPLGLNHTALSNRRYSGDLYTEFDAVRSELSRWRTYYLDPRDAMRYPMPPMETDDIGSMGDELSAYLYRLQQQSPEVFRQLQRVVRTVIPAVGAVSVELDTRRGTLDIQVEQSGTLYSSRVISEGTLRVLALCALAVNPEPAALIAYEEPENGVHPARLELVAKLLVSLAERRRTQVLVTTHSPLFASTILQLGRRGNPDVGLFTVSIESGASQVRRFEPAAALLADHEIQEALTAPNEGQLFEAMLRRGWLDE
jgi:predicted ATPase